MITITFECGHQKTADGGETKVACACGETRIAQVNAPVPRFRGHVTGPHAEYVALEPKAVVFEEKKDV